eukprot:5743667-Amphidinium_carterae.2
MAAICKTLGDPDDPLEDWFLQGAPAGVQKQPLLANTFPPKLENAPLDPDALYSDEICFTNYVAFDRCVEARETINDYVKK